MQTQQQWLGQVRWIGEEPPEIQGSTVEPVEYKPWTATSPAAVKAVEEQRNLETEKSIQKALSPTEKILLASVIISAIGLLYSIFGRRR